MTSLTRSPGVQHGCSSVWSFSFEMTAVIPETLLILYNKEDQLSGSCSSTSTDQSPLVGEVIPYGNGTVIVHSLSGWGAMLNTRLVQSSWLNEGAHLLINFLELRAIYLAPLHFSPALKRHHVLVRTNNMAAKAHLNNQGGSKSSKLQKEASKIL